MTTYKVYTPDGFPIYFNSLTELRESLDLSEQDVQKVARAKSTAIIETGDEIIILRDEKQERQK